MFAKGKLLSEGARAQALVTSSGNYWVNPGSAPIRFDPEDRSKIEIDLPALQAGRQAQVDGARERAMDTSRGEENPSVR